MIGKTLAHYEIVEKIGAGGMGEVYRAHDTKLGRDVAIKLLPAAFAADSERVARFQREARTLAALNHPNIAGIYGLEQHGSHRFLVMELVAGESLSTRIARGPIGLDEALDIARQIAEGLEEAHEQGIVHRDLKPGNVHVTPEGKVKVLDFGLARAYQGHTVDEGHPEHSPTITAAMTQQGVILGTAAYMSPEQARGKTLDRRTDLWSFGVILWEMLVGQRLFEGEDVSDTLAAVLRQPPPWDQLPSRTPPAVRRLLERCLERDPRKRLRDIGEARVRLERWADDPSTLGQVAGELPELAVPAAARRRALPWAVAALALAAAVWGWWPREPGPNDVARRLRLDVRLPAEDTLRESLGTNVQISPGGELIAYVTSEGIRLRRLDEREARLLSGTAGATVMTFSPDGEWIAFTAQGRLQRVSVTGGSPIDICEATDSRGLAWVNESTLVFTPNYFSGLFTASLQDGEVRPLTTLDEARNERTHRWPYALPDGRSLLYMCQFLHQQYDEAEIRIVTLDGEVHSVYRGGSSPRYARTGHLLFARDQTVFGIPLDLKEKRTTGLAVPVVSGVWTRVGDQEDDDGSAQFHVSDSGALIYRTASARQTSRLEVIDLETGRTESLGDPAVQNTPTLSPDGAYLAINRGQGNEMDVYLLDLETRVERRVTFGGGASQVGCWSHDSRNLYWSHSPGDGTYVILRRPADGSGPEEEVYRSDTTAYVDGVSPDEKWMLLSVWNPPNQWDVKLVSVSPDGAEPTETIFSGGPEQDFGGTFSPDGKWVSYFVDESNEWELFVRRFPDTGARWSIAAGASSYEKAWSRDGTALYVRDDQSIRRIPITFAETSLSPGRPEVLVTDNHLRNQSGRSASIAEDGSRAYVLLPGRPDGDEEHESAVVLVTDWLSELAETVPVSR